MEHVPGTLLGELHHGKICTNLPAVRKKLCYIEKANMLFM